jgi:translation initiation factor 3 subunit G
MQHVGSLTDRLAEKRRLRELARVTGLTPEGEMNAPIEEEPAAPARREGVYVPPSRKPGGMPMDRHSHNQDYSLRVSNLSETVQEDDLRELFSTFGHLTRVCVVRDRETKEHRGFAFVNFRYRQQAEQAMEMLDGYGFENMILHVTPAVERRT